MAKNKAVTLEVDNAVHHSNIALTEREKPTRPPVRRIKEGVVPKQGKTTSRRS